MEVLESCDSIIEECLATHQPLEKCIETCFDFLTKLIEFDEIYIYTYDETLEKRLFGIQPDLSGLSNFSLENSPFSMKEAAFEKNGSTTFYVLPINFNGETIGVFGASRKKSGRFSDDMVLDIMYIASEQLDNYFFAIQESRRKYNVVTEIQKALASEVLKNAIDHSIEILCSFVPLREVFLIFRDDDEAFSNLIQYYFYQNTKRLFDSSKNKHSKIEEIIGLNRKNLFNPDNREIEKALFSNQVLEIINLKNSHHHSIGKIFAVPVNKMGFSLVHKEMLRIFSECLTQRMVDFNRERTWLRNFFSYKDTEKLLSESNYIEKYLKPRQTTIGVMFADIAGFTKLCEQVLVKPERITQFIDSWSRKAVKFLFKNNGVLDKIVGDCILGLFGPPFNELPPGELARLTLKTAISIRNFTHDFLQWPENSDIRNSNFVQNFGVSFGVNLCSANIGLIGPNRNFTAFGSEINNTARLQGVAGSQQILLSKSIKEEIEKSGNQENWKFGNAESVQVKNVRDSLVYFRLLD
ncbi:MAG: adenylate/guanylate cyclase domain-containing protein [Candidatus Riflebacteria bacterium]|nr:adenylate/guanylate cyclase domain-containing protein [Candidatus Riflebacteria bacterium]